MNEKKEFIPVSKHFIIPENGNVLIKAVIPSIPSIGILSQGKNIDYSFDDIEIIGTSVERFKIGDKVIVADYIYKNPAYRVEVKYNHHSFTAIQNYIESLGLGTKYKEFTKLHPRIRVEELFIIPVHDIMAKIDIKKRLTQATTASLFGNIIASA